VSSERTTLFVDHARRYADLGWTTLRLNGKRPLDERWQRTRYAAVEEATGRWSVWGARSNMGVLLGASGLEVLEPDTPEALATLIELCGGVLPLTPTVQSGGKSVHLYHRASDERNGARDGLELRGGNQQCTLPPSVHPETDRPYLWLPELAPWEIKLAVVPEAVIEYLGANGTKRTAAAVGDVIPQGARHRMLVSLAGSMRRRGMDIDEILAALRATNEKRCRPPLPDDEVAALVEDVVERYDPVPPDPDRERLDREADRLFVAWDAEGADSSSTTRETSEISEKSPPFVAYLARRTSFTPPTLDPRALHGPAGEYALAAQKHTEASPVAILATTLVAFGNVVNRTPRVEVGGTIHHTSEFVLLVGPTSVGRKGEAMGIGKRPITLIDSGWATDAISRGFGSGESIVDAVRDPLTRLDDEGNEIVIDPGASDKRLLISEEEFGHVLAVAGREGSTLSALIRSAWDGHRLENRTKARTLLATNAHVSLLAGITPTELVVKTTELEAANGLLNRFLIVASRRQRLLPDPPSIPLEFDSEWSERFADALRFVRGQAAVLPTLVRDQAAQKLWESAYTTELSVERHGLAGAVCARAEAHALRLSVLYALLDQSTVIRREHLEAALALWRYCEASARLVFGDRLGDQVADAILAALRTSPQGLTRNEIVRLFSGHRRKDEIDAALALLLSVGIVVIETDTSGGRPATRVRLAERPEAGS
jgi:hypothetical protein